MKIHRSLASIAGVILASACVTSCNDPSKAAAEQARRDLSDKEVEVEDLKGEIDKLKAQVDEAKKAGGKTGEDPAGKANEAAGAARKELKEAREESEALKKELEQLRKENEKLKREATAKVRDRAIGEKHERVAARNGKTYRQVVIRKVDDFGVSFAHEAGVTTLREDAAPAMWVTRFRLQEEQRPGDAPSEALAARPVAAAPPVERSGSGESAKEGEVVRSKLPGILLIECGKGKGSGFLAVQDGSTWLYTAAHVLTSGKELVVKNGDGAALTGFGRCQVAVDCDLARIEVNVKPGLALNLIRAGGAAVGQDIVAVGNSAGSGVLAMLDGKLTAMGPKDFEVTASVIQGNSGGPVLSAATGEVIGVVCRAELGRNDIWASGTDFSKVRRFASRLDRTIEWRATSLESLQTENQRIAAFDSRTKLVLAMAALEPGQHGLRLDMQVGGGKGPTIMAIFMEHKNIAPVQRLIQMNRQLAEKQLRSSENDLKKRFSGFYRDLLTLFANDTAGFEPEHFSFVNRKEAELSLKWRKDATRLLSAATASLGR